MWSWWILVVSASWRWLAKLASTTLIGLHFLNNPSDYCVCQPVSCGPTHHPVPCEAGLTQVGHLTWRWSLHNNMLVVKVVFKAWGASWKKKVFPVVCVNNNICIKQQLHGWIVCVSFCPYVRNSIWIISQINVIDKWIFTVLRIYQYFYCSYIFFTFCKYITIKRHPINSFHGRPQQQHQHQWWTFIFKMCGLQKGTYETTWTILPQSPQQECKHKTIPQFWTNHNIHWKTNTGFVYGS